MKRVGPEKCLMGVTILCPGLSATMQTSYSLRYMESDQKHLFMKTDTPLFFHNKLGQVVEQNLYIMPYLLLERHSYIFKNPD